jgi:hypothetical protein
LDENKNTVLRSAPDREFYIVTMRKSAFHCVGAMSAFADLLLPLPPLRIGIPNAIGKQPIQIGKVRITLDVEAQAFAIVLARPFAIPYFPSRIVRVEVRTAERLPTAMRTGFNIAASTMALADRRTTIGTGSKFLAHASSPNRALIVCAA